MNNMTEAPIAADDAAWASINTPLDVQELMTFCQDVERLFRINPMLEFKSWNNITDNHYRMDVINSSQAEPFELDVEVQVEHQPDGLVFKYNNGIKKETVIKVEPSEFGSKLSLIDNYDGLSVEERDTQLQQVDKSLINWLDYLQRYLIMWKKWSRFGWWRWYMKRVWQPLKPSGRRIVYMFWWISLVEVALIALGAGIYLAEYT